MGYKQRKYIPVVEGGTGAGSFSSYAVICGGISSTDALTNVSGLGISFQALTSQGASSLPSWAELSNETFFERLSSDPSMPVVGQTWYNTTTHQFKGYVDGISSGAWHIVANYPPGSKITSVSSVGQDGNNALAFGGQFSQVSSTSLPFTTSATYLYDGIGDSWTSKQSMTFNYQGRGSAGDSTSEALAVAGLLVPSTASGNPATLNNDVERYSLSANTWTTVAQFIVDCYIMASSGTPDDAIIASPTILRWSGSYYTPPAVYGTSQSYDGAVWSSKALINSTRISPGARGSFATSSNGAMLCNGRADLGSISDPLYATCEKYNSSGNIWSYVASKNFTVSSGGGSGSSDNVLFAWGGNASNSASQKTSEKYNGISNTWTVAEDMVFASNQCSGAGNTTSALTVSRGSTSNNVQQYGGGSAAGIVVFDLS
jgi:hypothetical protein